MGGEEGPLVLEWSQLVVQKNVRKITVLTILAIDYFEDLTKRSGVELGKLTAFRQISSNMKAQCKC